MGVGREEGKDAGRGTRGGGGGVTGTGGGTASPGEMFDDHSYHLIHEYIVENIRDKSHHGVEAKGGPGGPRPFFGFTASHFWLLWRLYMYETTIAFNHIGYMLSAHVNFSASCMLRIPYHARARGWGGPVVW